METQFLYELRTADRSRQILLVRVNEQRGVGESLVLQQTIQRLRVDVEAVRVSRVQHVYERVHAVKVVGPQGSLFVLAAEVPASELYVFGL